MSENKIELKSVSELLGMKFFIPSYQHGYKWTELQIYNLPKMLGKTKKR